MISLVYFGFIVFAVASIIAMATIGSLIDGLRKNSNESEEAISKLQDEVFYLKLEIAKLKSENESANHYSRVA
ncbi:hypothetical protein E1B03_15385 [Citrobacter arsenatis]|uniref:Uncharacterized protein n=1 Tax=Citrobacter arsenatis TaxID=2546350 RepID=A0A4P6WPG4_9ENTR|nr:hypothetical protein [Citrobacter arsenatis]QBM23732.1 hypothetical protein E1B03_15385 [Citrobacter arsenatis]